MWVQDFHGPAGQPPDPEVWTHEVGGGGWGDHQRQTYTDDPANAALDGAGHLAITARHDFYLVVNLAIGGDWPGNEGEPDLPASLLVDWMQVSDLQDG